QLIFDVRLNPHFSKDLALNLGDKATALGLSVNGATNLTVDVGLDLDVEIGIDLNHFLADPTSITSSDAFVQVNTLTASGTIHTSNLNFGVTLAGASLGVVNGHLDFTPTATLTVQKPDGTKRITLQDLQTTSLGDLVSLNTSGALSATLPISGTLPQPLGNVGTATVVVTDTNGFSGAAPEVSVSFALSQQLQDKSLGSLRKPDQAWTNILGLSILDAKLPVIDKSINELFHQATTSGPSVGDFLKLKDAVAAYFASGTPDVAGLIQTLETKALNLVGASAH